MKSVIQFSLQQRVFYNLIFVLMIVTGAYVSLHLPVERYPNIEMGEVIINTAYPGASPADVETLVTQKIEDALETVEAIEWVRGTSFRAYSSIRLKFRDNANYDVLYDEVRFKILNRLDELPADIDLPEINNITMEDYLPVVSVNLTGDHGNRKLSLVAKELALLLRQVSGVKEVKLVGEYEPEFHVYLDPFKLRTLGVSFDEVARALKRTNLSIPAGNFKSSSGEYVIKVDETFNSPEQISETIIRYDRQGSFVRIGDVLSHSQLDYREPAAMASVNGENSLALHIIKNRSGNALDIKAGVEMVLEHFHPRAQSESINLVLTQDMTIHIEERMNTLALNMLFGMILVSVVVWYFMGLRNAGLVTIGIPFSFMVTMLIMYLTGNSLNELTLFSFVLVTGIIVDDAIVISENIYRHIQMGKQSTQAIIDGTSEVALPVISSSLTTVAAFLPMLIMTGSTGQFFALIPKAVSFAILASLFECLLILPIHYLDFGPQMDGTESVQSAERDVPLLNWLHVLTTGVLKLTLRFRLSCVILTLLAFIAALVIMGISISGIAPLVKIQFFPDDYTQYYVDIKGPADSTIEQTDQKVKEVSQALLKEGSGKVASVSGFAGYIFNENYEPVSASHYGTVLVGLPTQDKQIFSDPQEYLETIAQQLKKDFERDGYQLHIHAQKDGPPTGKDINVRVLGTNPQAIVVLTDELLRFMRNTPEIGSYLDDLGSDIGQMKRVIQFQVDHQRVAEFGLNGAEVARLAASILDGRYVGHYRLGDKEVDLKLLIDPAFIQRAEDALAIPLVEQASGSVLLRDLIHLQTYLEASELHRYQRQRAISLKANLKPAAPTSTAVIVQAIQTHYVSIANQYTGAAVIFGGEHDDTKRSFDSLMYAFLIAILVMYVILATQFQSYLQPLIILSAVVFALVGVVFGAMLTQTLFTVNSFIAILGVTGVVVNDALVLIDFMNKRYQSGLSRREAIESAVQARLRPIVLTTLTTSLGLLPMALGFPSYSLIWGTMATTFVTGLAAATLLTLFVVPVFWDLLQGWMIRRQSRCAN